MVLWSICYQTVAVEKGKWPDHSKKNADTLWAGQMPLCSVLVVLF